MQEGLLDATQLADLLGVRPATVRKWAREQRIPEIRISAKVRRFEYDAVLQAVRARDRGSRELPDQNRRRVQHA